MVVGRRGSRLGVRLKLRWVTRAWSGADGPTPPHRHIEARSLIWAIRNCFHHLPATPMARSKQQRREVRMASILPFLFHGLEKTSRTEQNINGLQINDSGHDANQGFYTLPANGTTRVTGPDYIFPSTKSHKRIPKCGWTLQSFGMHLPKLVSNIIQPTTATFPLTPDGSNTEISIFTLQQQ